MVATLFIRRLIIMNYRFTFKYDTDQNISANYYPIDSAIALRDLSKNKG
jgi:hypothetical protein